MSSQPLSVERFAAETLEDMESLVKTFGVEDVISADRWDSWAEARGRYTRSDANHVALRNQLRVKIIPALERVHGLTIVTVGPESYQLQTLAHGLKIAAGRFPQNIKKVNETKSNSLKRKATVLEAHGVVNMEGKVLLKVVKMIADHNKRQGALNASFADSMLSEVLSIQEAINQQNGISEAAK